jgi:hypothetical protein
VVRPGRRSQPAELGDGPVAEFAAELRKLRTDAGEPSLRDMEVRAEAVNYPCSRTSFSEAARGKELPTWRIAAAYVAACGVDPESWRKRWERTEALSKGRPFDDGTNVAANLQVEEAELSVLHTEPTAPPDDPDEPTIVPQKRFAARRFVAAVVAVLTAASVAGAVVLFLHHRQPPAISSATIVIQNMVASGPDGFTEDTTPAYLSTQLIPFCSRYNCEVPSTTMWTGAHVTAVCQKQGTRMSNANLGSEGIDQNHNAFTSSRWYGVRKDGSLDYIPEAYIRPKDRGGLGLPDCATV